MALPNLRRLFSSFRTEEEERDISRTAFFNLDFANDDLYNAGLARLRQSAREQLSVTEFITQYDEVRQIDKFAGLEREATVQMLDGTRVHELLDLQTAAPATDIDLDTVLQETASPELVKFLELLQKLVALADPQYGSVREMRMRGYAPNGCLLRGIIDGVTVSEKGLVVTETKTTRSRTLGSYQVRLAYHQALTYNWMLRRFLELGSVRSLARMFSLPTGKGVDSDLETLARTYAAELANGERAIAYLRDVGVAPLVRLQFLKLSDPGYDEEVLEVAYDEAVMRDVFRSRIDLFEGRRSAIAGTLREAEAEARASKAL